MSYSGRTYTRSTGEEVSPSLRGLNELEVYVRGLINEVNADLKDLDKADPNPRWNGSRIRLQAKKHAYKDVLQFIKDGKGIL